MSYSRKTIRSMPAAAPATRMTTYNLRWAVLLPVLLLATLPVTARAGLVLNEVVKLALKDDPAVAAARTRASAMDDNAIADGQLPDPKLKTGIYNLPLDDFDVNREPTTQLRVGIVQSFPRGKTLQYQQQKTKWLAHSEQAGADVTKRKLVRDVRKHFLELYYQVQAEQVIGKTRSLFAQMVDITQAHYANGRVSQQDVLRASLELSRLDDRTTRIRYQADKSRSALMKWIGNTASMPIDDTFPVLPATPAREAIDSGLMQHPVIRIESAKLEASNRKIQIAQEQYKPGWSAGLEYRKRFGDDPAGNDRADMMAAMVTVDLPLFTGKRQDKRLSASILQAESRQLNRDNKLRELRQMLNTDYANWQRLGERMSLYESRLLKESTANARASLNAYQNGVTEFTTLMRARITDLDVRLENLRVRVDRSKAQASLLYLSGEDQ